MFFGVSSCAYGGQNVLGLWEEVFLPREGLNRLSFFSPLKETDGYT
jgi:hypothetical protein